VRSRVFLGKGDREICIRELIPLLGRYEAATAIAAISAKHDAGQVRSPGGLLRYMVEAHQAGTLRLDRTLFGLVDGTGGLDRAKGGTTGRFARRTAREKPRRVVGAHSAAPGAGGGNRAFAT
jgi:Replication protein C C-terminal region